VGVDACKPFIFIRLRFGFALAISLCVGDFKTQVQERTMRDSKQRLSKLGWMVAAVATMLGGVSVAAQSVEPVAAAAHVQQPAGLKPVVRAGGQHLIVVSIPERKLVLMEDGAVKKVYPVAVGKGSTPSPVGRFTINARVSNPTYSHRGKVVGPGPKNPVGSRWMGLSLKGYGIHGTNEPGSIGKAASHGCIRMGKADLEELFAQVEVGDAVEIRAEGDAAVEPMPTETAAALSATEVTTAGGQN
jgi:lipoprotein-anchoring transpeptidase ErfK/SrfK